MISETTARELMAELRATRTELGAVRAEVERLQGQLSRIEAGASPPDPGSPIRRGVNVLFDFLESRQSQRSSGD